MEQQKGGHDRLIKVAASIEVYFPILFYNYFGALITGRLMEGGCLIGGHLMEVQLSTEWDDILHDKYRHEKIPLRSERS